MKRPLQYAQLSQHVIPYTPSGAFAADGYPLTALADWTSTRPLVRAWRSLSTLQQTITFDFGSAKTGTWVSLLNANFTQVQIAVSSNGSTFTDIVNGTTTLTTRTITRDMRDPVGFYKLFLAQAFTGKTHGRIVIPAQTPWDNAGYFKLGLVLWGNSLVSLSRHLQTPLSVEYVDAEYRIDGKDWSEALPAGINYANINPRNRFPEAEEDEWHTLRLMTPGTRLLVYYNLGKNWQVYGWERNRPASLTYQGKHQEIDTGFRTFA